MLAEAEDLNSPEAMPAEPPFEEREGVFVWQRAAPSGEWVPLRISLWALQDRLAAGMSPIPLLDPMLVFWPPERPPATPAVVRPPLVAPADSGPGWREYFLRLGLAGIGQMHYEHRRAGEVRDPPRSD